MAHEIAADTFWLQPAKREAEWARRGIDPDEFAGLHALCEQLFARQESGNGEAPAAAGETESASDDAPPGGEPHSWHPIDVVASGGEPAEPPSIVRGLVYPGRRHAFQGESDSGKSLLALAACTDEIKAGENVVYVDLEMSAADVYERLHAHGLSDEQIREQFLYLRPSQPIGGDPRIAHDLRQLRADRKPTLVVLDAFEGLAELHELDPDRAKDVERFYRVLVQPFVDAGAASIVLDHVVKNPENRGRYAIGSQRKRTIVDVALMFTLDEPFGRDRTGKAKITVVRDRPGHLPRGGAAEFTLSEKAGSATWTLDLPGERRPFRPTVLMERISLHVETAAEPITSVRQLEREVIGKSPGIRAAVAALLKEGYLAGPPFNSLKPYRKADEE